MADMTEEVPGQGAERRLLTITATARRLGVSPRIVRELIESRELPSLLFGKHVRIIESDVVAYEQRIYRVSDDWAVA